MTERFDFGTEDLQGKLVPAHFDEKNLTTDWLVDFMFDNNATQNPEYDEEYVGYIQLTRHQVGCMLALSFVDNWLRYTFFTNTLTSDDIKRIKESTKEFFEPNSNLTVEMITTEMEPSVFDNEVIFYFYMRCEEE